MSGRSTGKWPACYSKFYNYFCVGLAAICCGLSCTEKPIDSETVRAAFSHARSVQPRLSGFGFSPCSSTNDLVPISSCGSPTGELSRDRKRGLVRGIRKALVGTPSTDQLQAAALYQIASAPRDEDSLLKASAYLNEAALQEAGPHRQALIRSDLAATHLLLAEVLQSSLEVAASLEQSLWALELEPNLAEADFNRRLGLLLLGMDLPNEPSTDPWIRELQLRFQEKYSATATEKQGCPARTEIRKTLDDWSADFLQPLPIEDSCLGASKDHFLFDVVQSARTEPERFASTWRTLRAANQALRAFNLEVASSELENFHKLRPSQALSLEADWIEATISYQKKNYDTSLWALEALATKAVAASYFELAAKSLRLRALTYQVRGDYGRALEQATAAFAVAHSSGSSQVEATVLSLMVDIQGQIGQEDEAWNYIARALRVLDPKTSQFPRILCLQVAARLAQQRGFSRLANLTYESTMPLAENLGEAHLASALKERGEFFADIERKDLARLDLFKARQLLASTEISPDISSVLEEDLLYLEGRVGKDAAMRRKAAESALERFRESHYERNLESAGFALAQAQMDQGDPDAAIATLQAALSDLARLTSRVSWVEASALVETARPIADQLIGLQLDHRSQGEVLGTIGQYLGLRTGQVPRVSGGSEDQRLIYFVRRHELIVILQNSQATKLARMKVERDWLEKIRANLLGQVRANVPEARLSATTQLLADVLIAPFAQALNAEQPLTIIPDDVLTGIPFILLPFRGKDEFLIDRFSIGYSTDLRPRPRLPQDGVALIVGSTAREAKMEPLSSIGDEVEGVSQYYPSAHILRGAEATASRVKQELALNPEIGHFAGHFAVNIRDPLRSYFILESTTNNSGRLTLQDLILEHRIPFALLYLSACETGRSLPASANGLHGLAQAFSSSHIAQSVLSLWPLEDTSAAEIAIGFHGELAGGADPVVALRSAQLPHRSQPPAEWAALAVYY